MVGRRNSHDNLISNIIDRKSGRSKHSYMEQIKEKVAVTTYNEVKEMALDREGWIKLHRQERSP